MAEERYEEGDVHKELYDVDKEVHVQYDDTLALPLPFEGQVIAI